VRDIWGKGRARLSASRALIASCMSVRDVREALNRRSAHLGPLWRYTFPT
jgi:hypothetical protein